MENLKSCRLCERPREAFQSPGDPRVHYLCPHCQLIQMDEAHHLSPEKQKQRYLQHNNSEENQGYVEMFEKFIAAGVDPFLLRQGSGGPVSSRGIRVLDYGCGPGPVLAGLLRKRGHSVATYDLFFQPDEAYRDKTYDLITMTEVLEHLTDPLATLQGILPRLAPGGVLAVMTLFHSNDPEKFAQWWYRKDPTHVSFFTEETLGKMAALLGLTPLFCDGKKVMVFAKKTAAPPA